MWIIVGLPILIAILAVLCALWSPARRLVWPLLAVAAVNVVLTPFTSGEWFYQRAETPDYQQAVRSGDFTPFRDLLAQHDPHLQNTMIAIAVGLLISVALLAALEFRGGRGRAPSRSASTAVVTIVLVVAAGTLLKAYHLGALLLPQLS